MISTTALMVPTGAGKYQPVILEQNGIFRNLNLILAHKIGKVSNAHPSVPLLNVM